MRNRAKCNLCQDIIESFHRHDYVTCKCGEISIDGGLDYLHTRANDYANFMRVDDEGNEIVVKYVEKQANEKGDDKPTDTPKKPTKGELIEMLKTMTKNIENLPSHARVSPISHNDLYNFMLVIANILKEQ
jgi:hypothetical protein